MTLKKATFTVIKDGKPEYKKERLFMESETADVHALEFAKELSRGAGRPVEYAFEGEPARTITANRWTFLTDEQLLDEHKKTWESREFWRGKRDTFAFKLNEELREIHMILFNRGIFKTLLPID